MICIFICKVFVVVLFGCKMIIKKNIYANAIDDSSLKKKNELERFTIMNLNSLNTYRLKDFVHHNCQTRTHFNVFN